MAAPLMNEVARDYTTDGIPSSGVHEIRKRDLRAWGAWIEQIVTAFLSNGGVIYASKAALDADLAKAANTMAWVVEDATAANNGVYRKIGASGTGSWVRAADLPYSFIVASDVGAGTANAIQATSSLPVSGSALVLLNVYEANTGSPVTVSFNGGSPLAVKTNSGNDVAPGGLVSGMLVLGRVSGSTFRLVSDQASAAILAAAEAAANRAEEAESNVISLLSGVTPVFATKALAEIYSPATAPGFLQLVGYAAAGDGGGALYKQVASEPSHAGKFSVTLDDGVTVVWYEIVVEGMLNAAALGSGQASIEAAHDIADDIIIDRDFAITSTATWPNGKNYLFLNGGKLSVDDGVTLTIRGIVKAPASQKIFYGEGSVVGIRAVHPEWWHGRLEALDDAINGMEKARDCVAASSTSDGPRPQSACGGISLFLDHSKSFRPRMSP